MKDKGRNKIGSTIKLGVVKEREGRTGRQEDEVHYRWFTRYDGRVG